MKSVVVVVLCMAVASCSTRVGFEPPPPPPVEPELVEEIAGDGGGFVDDDVVAPEPEAVDNPEPEPELELEPEPEPAPIPKPSGNVRLEGRAFADDDGVFNAWGVTLMWGMWAAKHDPPMLAATLDWLAG